MAAGARNLTDGASLMARPAEGWCSPPPIFQLTFPHIQCDEGRDPKPVALGDAAMDSEFGMRIGLGIAPIPIIPAEYDGATKCFSVRRTDHNKAMTGSPAAGKSITVTRVNPQCCRKLLAY